MTRHMILYTLWVNCVYFVMGTYSYHCDSPLVVECRGVTAELKCVSGVVWVWMSDRSISYLPEFRPSRRRVPLVPYPTDLLGRSVCLCSLNQPAHTVLTLFLVMSSCFPLYPPKCDIQRTVHRDIYSYNKTNENH